MKSSGKQEATTKPRVMAAGAAGVRRARGARGSAASKRRRADAAAPAHEAAAVAKPWEVISDTPKVTGAMLDAAGGGDDFDDDDLIAELELAAKGAKSKQVRSALEGLKRHRATFNGAIFPEGGFASEDAAYDALGPAFEKERRVTGALRLYAKGEIDAERVLEEIARCRQRYAAKLAKR
jgi:hypothetical protein